MSDPDYSFRPDYAHTDDTYRFEGDLEGTTAERVVVTAKPLDDPQAEYEPVAEHEIDGEQMNVSKRLELPDGKYELRAELSDGYETVDTSDTFTYEAEADGLLYGTDTGMVDTMIDGALEAVSSLPNYRHIRPDAAAAGAIAWLDLAGMIGEGYFESELHGEPSRGDEPVSVGFKAFETVADLSDEAKEEKRRHSFSSGYEEAAMGNSIFLGAIGAGGTMIALTAAPGIPFYAPAAVATGATAANVIDRKIGTGQLDSWAKIDETLSDAYDRMTNAKDTLIDDAQTYWDRLWDDDLVEWYDVDDTEFTSIVDDLDRFDPDIAYLDSPSYEEEPVDVVQDLLASDEFIIEDEDLVVERRDTGGDEEQIIARMDADVRLASKLDRELGSHIAEDTVSLDDDSYAFQLEAAVPAGYEPPALTDDEPVHEADWSDERELVVEAEQ